MSKTVPIIVALTVLATLGALYLHSNQNKHKTFLTPTISSLFDLWMVQYHKHYTPVEEAYRRTIFAQNYKLVQEHNSLLGRSYNLGMNQFSDLPNEEFKIMNKGLVINSNYVPHIVPVPIKFPAAVDWTTQGAVTPVKNQGQCGSCYTFSSTGSMEGRQFLDTKTLISMSEQQLVDCSTSYGNQGCNGGLMDDCFQYSMKYGIETEDTYPYTAVSGTCAYSASSIIGWKPTGYTDVVANNSNAMLTAIAINPVSVAIDASGFGFQLYTGGIYNDPTCGTDLDHGVLAVGYDTTQGFIKIKNSWDVTWGEAGYIRFALLTGAGNPGQCGVYMQASYPLGTK